MTDYEAHNDLPELYPAPTAPSPQPADAAAPANTRQRVVGLARAARPQQWVKNVACFAGLMFSGQLLNPVAARSACVAFASYCLASSSAYLINDVLDRKSDRENVKKRGRPIASGLVPPAWAVLAAVSLVASAVALSFLLPTACQFIILLYLLMSTAYSLRLKHAVLIDVLIIALGFVLRVLYGVYAVRVLPTPWIVLCMFFLALFLGFAKRRSELNRLVLELADRQRPVLRKYRTGLLDLLLGMTATMAISSYALYTVTGGSTHNPTLVVSVPLVVYGVFRYLLLVIIHELGDAPEKDLLGDRLLVLTVILWVVTCIAIIYGKLKFFAPS